MLKMSVLFDHFCGKILGVAEDVLDRIDADAYKRDPYGALNQAMDEGLIYTEDQWTMMMEYQTPEEADFILAWEAFADELMECINEGAITFDEEDE